MKYINITTIALSFLLSACATTNTSEGTLTKVKPDLSYSQKENWKFMTGKWYGKQPTKDGGIKQQIMYRDAGGSYKITFRTHDKSGKYKEQTEAGHWGISGPIYFTSFRGWFYGEQFSPSDPADPYNYDAYKILKLNNKVFEYEAFSSQNKFSLVKVPNDFVFPEI